MSDDSASDTATGTASDTSSGAASDTSSGAASDTSSGAASDTSSGAASDTVDTSVDNDEQASVDDSESDGGDDSGDDDEGTSNGDNGEDDADGSDDDVVALATGLQDRIATFIAGLSIIFVIYLLISAFSARGMSKRYAKTYGLERMTMKQNVTWGFEVFANLMSAGLLGLAFDILNPNSGQCANVMMPVIEGAGGGMNMEGNPSAVGQNM